MSYTYAGTYAMEAMMAATARMILQVDPAEKARWAAEAGRAGISTAEYLRRAAAAFDPANEFGPGEAEMLRLLASELNDAATRIAANLDAALATARELNDPGREAAIKARVMAELEASGERLDFARLRGLSA